MTTATLENTTNLSTMATQQQMYRFIPIDRTTKAIFLAIFSSYLLIGVVGNCLLFFVARKLGKQQRTQFHLRRIMTTTFLQSLSACNLLLAVSGGFVNCTQLYLDFHGTDWSCRAIRFPSYVFSTILIFNLLIICLERYCAIFYPHTIPSPRSVKKLLVGAWVSGFAMGTSMLSVIHKFREELGPSEYTITCKASRETVLEKVFTISFGLFVYYIPNFLFIFIVYKVKRFLQERRRKVYQGKLEYLHKSMAWRYKDTRLFINILLTFVIPYTFFMVYMLLPMVYKPKLSFYTSWVIRRVTGVLALSNSVFVPGLCFLANAKFRDALASLFFPRKKGKTKGAPNNASSSTSSHNHSLDTRV